MGTVLPVTSRELPLDTSKSGVQVKDIAISGSTPAAELGTLTSLVGGNADVFQAALPGALRASGPVEESRQDFTNALPCQHDMPRIGGLLDSYLWKQSSKKYERPLEEWSGGEAPDWRRRQSGGRCRC